MPEAAIGTLCSAWATLDDLPEGCPCRSTGSGSDEPSDDVLEELLMQASEAMWVALAYPTLGPCERTVYPCLNRGTYWPSAQRRYTMLRAGACDCCGCDAVWLEGPVADVTEVIVDGDVVDPGDYELHANFKLVRVNGSWPAGGGPVSDQAFQITYEMGAPVPTLVRDAVVELTNELWLSRCGEHDGRIPNAVSSLSTPGVGMSFRRNEVAKAAREAGESLPKVYQALSTYNPTAARLRTFVWSPDAPNTNRTIRTFS